MANINIKISDAVHDCIRHQRIDTKQSNDEIIEQGLKFYFKSKGIKFEEITPSETPKQEEPIQVTED